MIGWALVEKATGDWLVTYTTPPNRISLPSKPDGALAMGDDLSEWEDGLYRMEEVELPDPVPSDPGLENPSMVAAAFNVEIANGDIQSIGGAFNLIAALYMDIGIYMLLFLEPEDDTSYVAQVLDGGLNIKITEKGLDYMIVEAKNAVGEYADPAQFGVQVYRF